MIAGWFGCDDNGVMSDVTQILSQIDVGDPHAAEQLLPLVYDELRKLAAAKLAQERPGQTLQATALVHEAYMQLVVSEKRSEVRDQESNELPAPELRSSKTARWDSRGHFFAAAAEAMRRILIQNARQKKAQKRGGNVRLVEIPEAELAAEDSTVDIFALSDALDLLLTEDPEVAALAKLRIFGGLSVDEAAAALGVPHTSAYRQWTYAQAWLRAKLRDAE